MDKPTTIAGRPDGEILIRLPSSISLGLGYNAAIEFRKSQMPEDLHSLPRHMVPYVYGVCK
jgi:hypothetical protein